MPSNPSLMSCTWWLNLGSKIVLGHGHDVKTDDGYINNTTSFVFATNVLGLDSLPTSQSYTYNMIGSTSLTSGSLLVNFASNDIHVNLKAHDREFVGNGNIGEFYTGSIVLNEYPHSFISGRFVGSGAEGAIGVYQLNYDNESKVGTAIFNR